ncbi:MAG: hypothetical protein BWY67_00916 [Bacteroidetes bacterium ADurb.Bin397]|nr:MAG: hypothetical protein BWY67_00916 [Bacteroidetes bacterium ADurb.Bin397]
MVAGQDVYKKVKGTKKPLLLKGVFLRLTVTDY